MGAKSITAFCVDAVCVCAFFCFFVVLILVHFGFVIRNIYCNILFLDGDHFFSSCRWFALLLLLLDLLVYVSCIRVCACATARHPSSVCSCVQLSKIDNLFYFSDYYFYYYYNALAAAAAVSQQLDLIWALWFVFLFFFFNLNAVCLWFCLCTLHYDYLYLLPLNAR